MNVEQLAQNLYEEINFSRNICISFLKHWIIKNMENLNNLLDEILKKLHEIENFNIKEKQSLNMIIDKESYPKVNRNAVYKSYKNLKKDAEKDLQKMVTNYKNRIK